MSNFIFEYQNAIHFGLIYENTMYSDKYNNWLDNREEDKKEETLIIDAWQHGVMGHQGFYWQEVRCIT